MQHQKPPYAAIFWTVARNSLIREMTFRVNFIAHSIALMSWTGLQLVFYNIIFQFRDSIGKDTGWTRYPFFMFLGTVMVVNSLMQTFFMPNLREFSEMIRKGNLDFVLLKPIDTQFLVTFNRIDWSSMANFALGLGVIVYSMIQMHYMPTPLQFVLFPFYLLVGVSIYYSTVLLMSCSSVWMGRNQSLDQLWFYITTFSRYPMEIYQGSLGVPIRWIFTTVFPVLLVVNVPARVLAKPLDMDQLPLAGYAVLVAIAGLFLSRMLFKFSLNKYRSASS
ncbi:MAG TPA: ABC transporter permease [Phycisphaerales bacterium]|nr:ABC transporter permease [Phycisphaerales bacterium]HCD32317.1 ABC transporter permease [Phycisphaerales bacterium]|tara:strand:+ start:519 stop:1349 length:831 start_codon:yes stop_codon:yes gene_type:complete